MTPETQTAISIARSIRSYDVRPANSSYPSLGALAGATGGRPYGSHFSALALTDPKEIRRIGPVISCHSASCLLSFPVPVWPEDKAA